MKAVNKTLLLLALSSLSITACKKDNEVIIEPQFENFGIEGFTRFSIRTEGKLIPGNEKILQYGVFVSDQPNITLDSPDGSRHPIDSADNTLYVNVMASTVKTLYVKAYAITDNKIYYSKTLGIHDSDYYILPYKGGKMMITNHKYEFAVKQWGNYGEFLGAVDHYDGRKNVNSLSKNSTFNGLYDGCKDLTVGGYTDWYTPSIDELNSLLPYGEHMLFNWGQSYWSSSEKDQNEAWAASFNVQKVYSTSKSQFALCRCIRRE